MSRAGLVGFVLSRTRGYYPGICRPKGFGKIWYDFDTLPEDYVEVGVIPILHPNFG